jgi:putative membrane protein
MDPKLEHEQTVYSLERPAPVLLRYYFLFSLLFLPVFPFVFFAHYLRYRTLRYRFDDEGISMRWGALRRREINLTYGRIQDIHLTSGVVERWLGLAKIQIQTASGSHKPEMTIEGILEYESLRQFLERRMRRERDSDRGTKSGASTEGGVQLDAGTVEQLTAHLQTVTEELRRVRQALERGQDDG